ncbi:alpha-hydroxy-acid oxidizing protein [Desulfovibrio sp. OttesenSCG-928-O18]|nr:alpha-hydroxy-acid oxidizing protein [Desulfovibrio sp. OttesenSCG-928-O18]
MQELRNKARQRVKSRCRVCPVCDGRACAGEIPGMGGIGTGMGFRNNFTALAAYKINMRVLHDANDPSTRFSLWGREMALPVFAAPVGNMVGNGGSDLTNPAFTEKYIDGCVAANTLASIGDLADFEDFKSFMRCIRGRGKHVVPFIKPWIREDVLKRLDYVANAGCDVCGMDVDAAGLTLLRRLSAPVEVKDGEKLAEIISLAHERGMKFIAKGVMTADEAILAADAGADAVLVSNHGGRVLDHTPGTAEVLPAIVEAVGERVLVMMDGAVRTGVDVLKVLALGAKAALICRPVAVILHGDEEKGIPAYFAKIQDELSQAMRLTGCKDIASITRRVIY